MAASSGQLEKALASNRVIISVIGDHGGKSVEENYREKMQDITNAGFTYWLVKSPAARHEQVLALCRAAEERGEDVYMLWIGAASKGGAKPTALADPVTKLSEDGVTWKDYPTDIGIGPVTGKLDKQTAAFVFELIEIVDEKAKRKLSLWDYADANTGDGVSPIRMRIGSSTVCAVRHDTSSHPDRIKSGSRAFIAFAKLRKPYCVLVK